MSVDDGLDRVAVILRHVTLNVDHALAPIHYPDRIESCPCHLRGEGGAIECLRFREHEHLRPIMRVGEGTRLSSTSCDRRLSPEG